ncbi:MAG: hypothetical protein REI09_05730 [Candidatus Dactylopiibacterium sp.]|nr:hypothetical protein [Candidatus Dactylopiibacterium sp.]
MPARLTQALLRYLDRTFLDLGRQMRWSYLPPLMVYMAFGVSGITGVVGTFYVKESLSLTAQDLATLGFWALLPWALKLPMGHAVDLLWRWKSWLVWLGAALVTASFAIMVGLLGDRALMETVMPADAWFQLSVLVAPLGFVLQDVVADAMTVEAVPHFDARGQAIPHAERRLMNTTMQTLGRVAIIGGLAAVALINVSVFRGVSQLDDATKHAIYLRIYLAAMCVPALSVAGVLIAGIMRRREARRLARLGVSEAAMRFGSEAEATATLTQPNWAILGGSLAFVAISVTLGVTRVAYGQELIFLGSATVILFLLTRLARELAPETRATLLGTCLIVFAFRATPSTGSGVGWWQIDVLGFDQQFLSVLDLISYALTLAGLFGFRRLMAEKSIAWNTVMLTVVSTVLALPTLAMAFGLHEWTAAMTGGIVDARFIAIFNTALESPLGQLAMVQGLAWMAISAPPHLKATYLAVMASFYNLALSAAQLGTKYLNQFFVITREVRDASGAVVTPADYSALQPLLICAILLGLAMPLAAVALARARRWRSA